MDEPTQDWKDSAAITGLILFVSLISPIGAPVLGLITIEVCDIPWEGSYQCIVPDAVLGYFLIFWWGPFFVLGLFAIVWFALSLAFLVSVGWLFGRAVWGTISRRW